MFELEKHPNGYRVVGTQGHRKLYVRSFRDGKYKFTIQHCYARVFTEATARKHADALNERSES